MPDYKRAYEVAMENYSKLEDKLAKELGLHKCQCVCSKHMCHFHLQLCKCSTPGCTQK